MSKEERRQRFEAKIKAEDEMAAQVAAEELQRQQEAYMLHERLMEDPQYYYYHQQQLQQQEGQQHDPNFLLAQESVIDPVTGQAVLPGTEPFYDPHTGQPLPHVAVDPQTGQPLAQLPASHVDIDPVTGQPVHFDPTTGQPLSVVSVDPATGQPIHHPSGVVDGYPASSHLHHQHPHHHLPPEASSDTHLGQDCPSLSPSNAFRSSTQQPPHPNLPVILDPATGQPVPTGGHHQAAVDPLSGQPVPQSMPQTIHHAHAAFQVILLKIFSFIYSSTKYRISTHTISCNLFFF